MKYTKESKQLRDKIVSFAKSLGFRIDSSEKQARAYQIWMEYNRFPRNVFLQKLKEMRDFLAKILTKMNKESYNTVRFSKNDIEVTTGEDPDIDAPLLITHWYATPTRLDRGIDATVSDRDYFGEIRSAIREAITSNDSKRWNDMSTEQRADLLKRSDPTMRDPRWSSLVRSMASKMFNELSSVQQDAVVYALKRPVARSGR